MDFNYDFTPSADDLQSVSAAEPQSDYAQHNYEMNLAWQFIASTATSVFLTGKAGTGKTTFLRKLRQLTPKRMVVLAPTGVAAINAGGQTIHSFFQLPLGPFIPGVSGRNDKQTFKMSDKKKAIIRTLDLLVIDEISMVRADLLDQVDGVLRQYRDRTRPFGGVQLLLIGDLMQLSPVTKYDEWEMLAQYYDTPYFFSSRALKQLQYVTVELHHIYRQQDSDFVRLLACVRSGRLTQEVIDALNSRYIKDFRPHGDDWIRLTTHNHPAQQYNDMQLGLLPGAPQFFDAVVKGDFPEYSYPTDARMVLKVGAQVMFVKNDLSPAHAYYNGKVGIVTDLDEDYIEVTCNKGTEKIKVVPTVWDNVKYTIDPESKTIKETIAGSFMQYPLRLAWAITVHKSQGLTFDHAVLDINAAFAHGQVYVALSRCRTLEGLVLSNPIISNSVITDTSVNAFIDSAVGSIDESVRRLPAMKYEYMLSLLDELYSFKPLTMALNWLTRVVDEHLTPRYASLLTALKDTAAALNTDVAGVAARFTAQYHQTLAEFGGDLNKSPLPKRIKDSSTYFVERLHKIFDMLLRTAVINIDNKQTAQTYNNALASLRDCVTGKIKIFEKLQDEDFSTRNYLNFKAQSMLEDLPATKKAKAPKYPKSPGKSKPVSVPNPDSMHNPPKATIDPDRTPKPTKAPKAPKEPKPNTIEETYKLYKQGLSIPEIAAARGFVVGTIYSHLSKLAAKGLVEADNIVPPARQRMIRDVVSKFTDSYTLTQVHEALPEDFSFDEIRFVLNLP